MNCYEIIPVLYEKTLFIDNHRVYARSLHCGDAGATGGAVTEYPIKSKIIENDTLERKEKTFRLQIS